jgi:hypothetical protein
MEPKLNDLWKRDQNRHENYLEDQDDSFGNHSEGKFNTM